MCLAANDYKVGVNDLILGEVHGVKFYMHVEDFERKFARQQITVDAMEGASHGFSLEITEGVVFQTLARVFTEVELALLSFPQYSGV